MAEQIDRKYIIEARSRAHPGKVYTEWDGVFFKTSDPAFNRRVLDAYKQECIKLGVDNAQIEGIDLLTDRLEKWRGLNPDKVKVPDVDKGEEARTVLRANE